MGETIKLENLSYKLTYATLFILALAIFTSLTLSAASHIFILVPGVYFLARSIKLKDLNFPKSTWALLLIFISIFISVIFNLDIIDQPHKNIFKGKYFIFAILWAISFREYFKNKITSKQIKILLCLFLIATSLASLSGLIGLFSGFNPLKMKPPCHPERACGVYGMYMTYGYGISLFLILNFGLFLYRDQVKKYAPSWLIIASFLINFLGLYFSYARGGLIAFLVSVPFFFLKNHLKKFIIILISGGVLLLGAIAFIPKVNTMFLNRAESNNQRISFFKTAFMAFQERPLFGYGYRNFEPHVKRIKKKYDLKHQYLGGHAHNNFLEHLASTGLLGALCFILFNGFWFVEMFKRNDVVALIVLPFIVNFSVSGLFQYTFGDGENLFLLLGVYAISVFKKGKTHAEI